MYLVYVEKDQKNVPGDTMGILTNVEEIFNIPADLLHRKDIHPVDLNRMAIRSLEKGCRKGLKKLYAPNHYIFRLNSDDYNELFPFFSAIKDDVMAELERVIEERNCIVPESLVVEIVEDSSLAKGSPVVESGMAAPKNPDGKGSGASLEAGPVEYSLESHKEPATIIADFPHSGNREGNIARSDRARLPFHHPPLLVYEGAGKQTREMILQSSSPGVRIIIGSENAFVENSHLHHGVTVNGRCEKRMELVDGAELVMGTLSMKISTIES